MMQARIYGPLTNALASGKARRGRDLVHFEPRTYAAEAIVRESMKSGSSEVWELLSGRKFTSDDY